VLWITLFAVLSAIMSLCAQWEYQDGKFYAVYIIYSGTYNVHSRLIVQQETLSPGNPMVEKGATTMSVIFSKKTI